MPELFYHGTTDKLLESIKEGLSAPYLTVALDKALYYAEEAALEHGGSPIVLSILTKDIDSSEFRVDYPELDEPVSYEGLSVKKIKKKIQKAYSLYSKKYPAAYNNDTKVIAINPHHFQISLETTATIKYNKNIKWKNISII